MGIFLLSGLLLSQVIQAWMQQPPQQDPAMWGAQLQARWQNPQYQQPGWSQLQIADNSRFKQIMPSPYQNPVMGSQFEVPSQRQAPPQNMNTMNQPRPNNGQNFQKMNMNEQPIIPNQMIRQAEVSQQQVDSIQDVPSLTARTVRGHQQPGGVPGSLPSLSLRPKNRPNPDQQGNRKPSSRNEDNAKTGTGKNRGDSTKGRPDVEGGRDGRGEKDESKEKHMLTRQRLNGIYSRL